MKRPDLHRKVMLAKPHAVGLGGRSISIFFFFFFFARNSIKYPDVHRKVILSNQPPRGVGVEDKV